jgi:undecaprenyl-diphosphatase
LFCWHFFIEKFKFEFKRPLLKKLILLETINHIDTWLFLLLNGLHSAFFDFVMYWISDRFVWIPMYAVLAFLLIRQYKWRSLVILLLVALAITTSDQITYHLKNFFERPRPCHAEALQGVVHTVRDSCGGSYGFMSGHAANVFALALLLIPFFKNRYRYFPLFILVWAAVVAYSRIYLGVHYPADILAGAFLGALIGWGYSRIYFLIFKPTHHSQAPLLE